MPMMEMADMVSLADKLRHQLRLVDNAEGTDFVGDLNDLLTEVESQAWRRGWDLGTGVVQRELDRRATQLLQVAAAMKGKDRADGTIGMFVYPDPKVYDWWPEGSLDND